MLETRIKRGNHRIVNCVMFCWFKFTVYFSKSEWIALNSLMSLLSATCLTLFELIAENRVIQIVLESMMILSPFNMTSNRKKYLKLGSESLIWKIQMRALSTQYTISEILEVTWTEDAEQIVLNEQTLVCKTKIALSLEGMECVSVEVQFDK